MPQLPDRPRLDVLINEAGLPLVRDEGLRAYRAPTVSGETTGLESRVLTQSPPSGVPLSLSAGQLDSRLRESALSRSFLALGLSLGRDHRRLDKAVALLQQRYDAQVLDLTGVLLDALRGQSEGKIAWSEVVAADAKQPGSREALGLARLVDLALPAIDTAIDTACAAEGTHPVLLVEAAPLARYERLSILSRWTDIATRRGQAIWLLVPQLSGNTGAMVDGRPLPLAAPGQYVRLDEEWLTPEAVSV